MMLAIMRSGTWEWALFFHVLGALVLIGSVAVVSAAPLVAGRGRPDGAVALRRLAFRTLLFLVVPSFVLLRATAEWVRGEDGFADEVAWINVGYIVTDAGLIVLLVLIFLGWRSARAAARSEGGPPLSGRILSVVAPLYLVALLVALWAMTTKPD